MADDRPQGLKIFSGPYVWSAAWPGINAWGETPATIWLWADGMVIFPKRLLTPSDLDSLRALLDSSVVDHHPARSGFEVIVRPPRTEAEAQGEEGADHRSPRA